MCCPGSLMSAFRLYIYTDLFLYFLLIKVIHGCLRCEDHYESLMKLIVAICFLSLAWARSDHTVLNRTVIPEIPEAPPGVPRLSLPLRLIRESGRDEEIRRRRYPTPRNSRDLVNNLDSDSDQDTPKVFEYSQFIPDIALVHFYDSDSEQEVEQREVRRTRRFYRSRGRSRWRFV